MIYSSHNWLVHKIVYQGLRRETSGDAHGIPLDIGSGEISYEIMTKPHVAQHLGLDQPNMCHAKSKIDLFGTAYDIPAEDGEFDSAICTAVLEHLEEPDEAIKEANQVSKRGGYAIYAVPFIFALARGTKRFL